MLCAKGDLKMMDKKKIKDIMFDVIKQKNAKDAFSVEDCGVEKIE